MSFYLCSNLPNWSLGDLEYDVSRLQTLTWEGCVWNNLNPTHATLEFTVDMRQFREGI